MDNLMLFHANSSGEELEVIDDIVSLDMEINIGRKATEKDNSFSVSVSESSWAKIPITIGDMVYIPGTEWGGVVSSVVHRTASGTVTVSGTTWRGVLFGLVVEPVGQAYVSFSGLDANRAIDLAIAGRLPDLITVNSASSGVNVSGQWRYRTVADCLHSTFSDYDLRLSVVWDNITGKMILSAEPVDDLTEEIELSQDYGVDFTSEDGSSYMFNRCLALGRGQLEERLVVSVYYMNGTFYTEKPSGWDDSQERTIIYDASNSESVDDLIKGAKDRLSGYIPRKSITINQVTLGLDTQLGDIIGARDRLTGMVGSSKVSKKILTIKNGTPKIDMGVE